MLLRSLVYNSPYLSGLSTSLRGMTSRRYYAVALRRAGGTSTGDAMRGKPNTPRDGQVCRTAALRVLSRLVLAGDEDQTELTNLDFVTHLENL